MTIIVIVVGLLAVAVVLGPALRTWWQCQQLAPIERMFVRGC